MSSIFRREHKRKINEHLFEEPSNIQQYFTKWETEWPNLVEKLSSSRSEVRISSLEIMNNILTSIFVGSDIQPFLTTTFSSLLRRVVSANSKHEHDSSLSVICSLCLNTFHEFEPYSSIFLREFVPSLNSIRDDQSMRIFTISFVTAFTISRDDIIIKVFKCLRDFIFENSSSNITTNIISECISGIQLIISSLPSNIVSSYLYSDLITILDLIFTIQQHEIIIRGISLFGVIYESLFEFEENHEEGYYNSNSNSNDSQSSNSFIHKYRTILFNLINHIHNKEQKKAINNKLNEVLSSMDEDIEEEFFLSNQAVRIKGLRNITKLSSIRRVSGCHFFTHMTHNHHIHELFDIHLISYFQALSMKNNHKENQQRDRTQHAKEREHEISKQRHQKEINNSFF